MSESTPARHPNETTLPLKRKSVFITVPNNGNIHPLLHLRLLQDTLHGAMMYEIEHQCPVGQPVYANRVECLERFMASGKDYWLTIDSDVIPEGSLLSMISHGVDVCAGVYPLWRSPAPAGARPWCYGAFDQVETGKYKPHEPTEGLQEVDAVAFGAVLMTRAVAGHLAFEGRGKLTHPLWPVVREGRVVLGEDFHFCQVVKSYGHGVFADFDMFCEHAPGRLFLGQMIAEAAKGIDLARKQEREAIAQEVG